MKNEANIEKNSRYNINILGVNVSGASSDQVLKKLTVICNKNVITRPFFVVTAYSEFFLEAMEDRGFAAALDAADLVVADGVSIPAAADYLEMGRTGTFYGLMDGVRVGFRVLAGRYAGEVVSGVRLTENLFRIGNGKKWKIFLLGGYGNTADRLAEKLKPKYPGLKLDWDRAGRDGAEIESRNREILKKINRFAPDILLVALGRYKQEKWIAGNKAGIRAKVVVGVGSSFDELLGEGLWAVRPPAWVERSGLKWLWRVTRDPKHMKRAWRAFGVFGWKIFRSR